MNKQHWMFNCREISSLVSQSMDKDLNILQRMGISFHLMMCSMCAANKKQLHQLRQILRNHNFPEAPLPQEAKLRIKEAIKEHNKKE